MRIYLDVSCLSRPVDDQWQERVRLEAEAIALILHRCGAGAWQHLSSDMARIEVDANPDAQKRAKVIALLPAARDIISLSENIFDRAMTVQRMGLSAADATHVAAA